MTTIVVNDVTAASQQSLEQSDHSAANDQSPKKVSVAEKELGELRALGLTKAISSRGLEMSESSHKHKKKEDDELEALRGLGLTSAKTKPPLKNEDQGEEQVATEDPAQREQEKVEKELSPTKDMVSAQKELGALRSLGLTKVVASKGFESEWHPNKKKAEEELQALRGLGLTSAKTKPTPPTENQGTESAATQDPPQNDQNKNVENELSPTKDRVTARKELGELRSLGLTKVVASKGFESEWHPNKKKAEEELEALRGLGLTSAKTKPTPDENQCKEQIVTEDPAQRDQEKVDELSPTKDRVTAQKELGELRSLGLAKVVASKGFESEWHPNKKKAEEELQALRGLGLTSAKTKPPMNDETLGQDPAVVTQVESSPRAVVHESSEQTEKSAVSEPPAAKEKISSAEKELGELRALGLTKAVSSRGLESGSWHMQHKKKEDEELKALKGLGLTSAKVKPTAENEETKLEAQAMTVETPTPSPVQQRSDEKNMNDESSPKQKKRSSAAEKELGELRALGLTKAIASQGFESEWHPHEKKEDEELKALRGHTFKAKEGFTTA